MITSRDNETLKLVRKLLGQRKHREETGLFAAEGEDLVEAASGAGIEPVHLLVAGETVEEELLARVSTLPHPARAIGVYRRADLPTGAREHVPRPVAAVRPRQRRHPAPHGRRVRRLRRALGGLRRPALAEGAACLARARSSARRSCRWDDRPRPLRRARRPRRRRAGRTPTSRRRSRSLARARNERACRTSS